MRGGKGTMAMDEILQHVSPGEEYAALNQEVEKRLGGWWDLGRALWFLSVAVPAIYLWYHGLLINQIIGLPIAVCTVWAWEHLWRKIHERRWLRLARQILNERGKGRLCIDCGYDLTGNTTGRCPECGAVAVVVKKGE